MIVMMMTVVMVMMRGGCCYLCHCTENKEAVQYKLGNEKRERREEREPGSSIPPQHQEITNIQF